MIFTLVYIALAVEDSEKSVTTWHNIVIGSPPFQKYVQDYVTKGSRVLVDGSLGYYKYTLPDGTTKITANIKASKSRLFPLSMGKTVKSLTKYHLNINCFTALWLLTLGFHFFIEEIILLSNPRQDEGGPQYGGEFDAPPDTDPR